MNTSFNNSFDNPYSFLEHLLFERNEPGKRINVYFNDVSETTLDKHNEALAVAEAPFNANSNSLHVDVLVAYRQAVTQVIPNPSLAELLLVSYLIGSRIAFQRGQYIGKQQMAQQMNQEVAERVAKEVAAFLHEKGFDATLRQPNHNQYELPRQDF